MILMSCRPLDFLATRKTQRSSYRNEDTGSLGCDPEHLLVLVHGIDAGMADWAYAEAVLKKELGCNLFVYVSSSNTYKRTHDGIDKAGERLANEVMQVVKERCSLKKISFLAHSLGGLIARYAIASLYSGCMIAGLEPIHFITLATPHLGLRGKGQFPILFGFPILEKFASAVAPFFVGRSGYQIFMTDSKPSEQPLLLRMTSDHENLKFISSLASFQHRTLYANVSYDHMVGWHTSSIRRKTENPKHSLQSLEGYQHIVKVVHCPSLIAERHLHETTRVEKANLKKLKENHDTIEEEMINRLERVGWKKVDVSFHSTFWPFMAHTNINVRREWINSAGTSIIAHVADCLREEQ